MSPIEKAVILARGVGKRMRAADDSAALDASQSAAAASGLKAMIPFGRPFLDYLLSSLADAGFSEVCLVVAPDSEIRGHYQRHPPRRVRVSFAVQPDPLGTADAVLAAELFSAGREFAVLNSDNLYPVECLRALRQLDGPGLAAFPAGSLVRGSNIPPERLLDFAILSRTADGRLADIVEKPQRPRSQPLPPDTMISMNLWRFDPAIFPFCRAVAVSPRGERELPRAVCDAVAAGLRLRTFICTGSVLDLSRRADIAAVAERLANFTCDP